MTDLKRLNDADALIREIVVEMGLEVMPQEFDVVPAQKMLEIMAYRLPVNFSHWSFGRDYEIERTKFEHGYAVPYEVVFNSDPCRAYLMDTNPFVIQVLVMAHVYAHNDFMKNSLQFSGSRRDMITSASEAAARFRSYEEDYGIDAVERIIDAGMAVQWHLDPGQHLHNETEERARERLYGYRAAPDGGEFTDMIPSEPAQPPEEKREMRKRTPPEPMEDILGYVIDHSPRPLAEWERDVLSSIRGQAQYFLPYRSTKIMNEGWATFWHEQIMRRLFAEGFLSAEEHGLFNLYNARVKAHNPRSLNPYLLGWAIFNDIEENWHKDESTAEERRQKLFDVRRTHMDWFFIHEFLSERVVNDLDMYVYLERENDPYYDVVVEETGWKQVKEYLLQNLMNSGIPRILVVNGNYKNSVQLYLQHSFEGLPLDEVYARRTLEHIYYLWDRPVYLETREPRDGSMREKVFLADEHGVNLRISD